MVSPALVLFGSTSAIREESWKRHQREQQPALEAVSAQEEAFCGSPAHSDSIRIPRAFVEGLTEAVCC